MPSFRVLVVAVIGFLLGLMRLPVDAFTPVDPDDALGIWDFNSTALAGQSADLLMGVPIVYQGGTTFSSNGAGRSGQAGDRAMNFGTSGSNSATISHAAFMALLNSRNLEGDQLSVVMWQRWNTAVSNSSSIWFNSASATASNRGFQAHVPWSDNTIYFDTSGCCASPSQRLSVNPSNNWQNWTHIALIKNGGAKQIWVNGVMVASQSSGASALLGDWTSVLLGQQGGSSTGGLKGMIDDLAIFSTALDSLQIAELASGASPSSILVPLSELPPQITSLVPAAGTTFHPVGGGLGFTVQTVSPNTLGTGDIRLFLNGEEITNTLSFGGTAQNRTVTSSFALLPNRFYSVRAEATDQESRTGVGSWTFDTSDPATTLNHPALNLPSMAEARVSGSGAALASLVDGNAATFGVTADVEGSYIELELDRKVRTSRIDLTAPMGAEYDGILDGARLRVYGLDEQLLYEGTVPSVEPGGTWAFFLPPGIDARLMRIDHPNGQLNGLGDHRLGLADWRVIGDPSPEAGPLNLAAIGVVTQSSTNGANAAGLAIDGNWATSSQTQNLTNSHWLLTLDRERPLTRVEIVAPNGTTSTRVGGLVMRLLDAESNTVAIATVSHPGVGGTWGFDVPANTADVKFVRIGLENNATNGFGDRVVSLGGVNVFNGINHALNTPSYMVRLTDALPSPALANDGNHATFTETTAQTVDGHWETDLGQTRVLYSVRVVAFDSGADQQRLTHATLRLFDENHESVFSKKLSGTSADFDIALPGPVSARYVRVGLENKERTSANGGIEWLLRLREVQAFGVNAGVIGIPSFVATPASILGGEMTTLTWQEEDLRRLALYPGFGSVGEFVDAEGAGSLMVAPAVTTEYLLVGENHDGQVTRAVTVVVDGQMLPVRVSEFVASNQFSLTDGYGQEPDWIELHNPNGVAVDLTGHGLSDSAGNPFKWVFPGGTTIPANGHLIVFASGDPISVDPFGNLHANFSLSALGESVVLTAPGGQVLDAVYDYPAQRDDLAYGRALDGTTGFLTPTPRGHNLAERVEGWLAAPVFSHARGFYDAAFSLTLSHPDPAAELFYSTDGTEPSVPYVGPIAVNGLVAVRAGVRRAGYVSPATETHTYLFRDSVMSSPLMSTTYTQGALSTRLRNGLTQIPTISLTVPALPDDYNERPASIEVFLPDGSPPMQVNAGLARFGGAWTEFAKKSYRVRFRSEYGAKKLESPLFRGFDNGMPALDRIDTLDLSAGNHDAVERGFYMSNRFVEDTMLEMGSLNPHGRYAHVYINGVYWGQYNAHERLDDDFLAGYLGGSDDDYLVVRGNDNVGDNFVTGTPDPDKRAAWETVRANRNSYMAVRDRLDVPHLIDFMLVWFYGNNESEFRAAGPEAPGTGFKFWLADADGFLRTSALTLDRTNNSGPGGLFGALVSEGHPDFRMLLADRIHRHFFNGGALTPEKNLARLNKRMAEIQDSLIAECARWGYRTPSNWESAAQTIRTGLFPQRTTNLLNLLKTRGFYPSVNAPVFGKHGGSVATGEAVTISGSAGTLYYTVDGTDPRLPGGGVSPNASTAVTTSTTLFPVGSSWRYRDLGSLPAANWASPAYDDSTWPAGNAPLGYGTSDEGTVVSFGPNSGAKYPTTYFRKSFNVANPASITGLSLGLVRDDGAVVYINGTEVVRSNMPTGTIGYSTLASSAIEGNNKLTVNSFNIAPGVLVAGNNVIAVEVHQVTAGSSDLRFDLSLTQSQSPSVVLDENSTVNARLLAGGVWSALNSADFQVAYPLATAGPYAFSEWSSAEPAGSGPPNLTFYQTDVADPVLAAPMDARWELGYDLATRSRIVGLGEAGVGFINTGNPQAVAGAGFVGSAVLSLDTQSVQDIRVRWTGGTVVPNERDYGIRLQYRVGNVSAFQDVLDAGGQPVEYVRSASANHSQVMGPVSLPAAADNQPLVEVRWRYHYRGGSGSRPLLRLDEIQISAGPVMAESLNLVSVPQTAQAGSVAGLVVVHALGSNGVMADSYNGPVTVAIQGQPGMLGGTVTRNAVNGVASFDDLVFPTAGVFTVTAEADGLTGDASSFVTRVAGLTELVMPAFIQGAYPENSQRVPHAALLRIEGLMPSTTYRYGNQMVADDDGAEVEGVGNMIFVTGNSGDFIRTASSPRFLPEDLNVRHGEFTTGLDGSHTGWFITEPTGNVRFTPGAEVFSRILLNDGDGGDVAHHVLTADVSSEVMAFGTGTGEGSALYGESEAAAKNLMVLYADVDGLTQPLAATPIEGTGVPALAGYAPFYQTEVAGQAGRWGTLVPNGLAAGVRRFEVRDRTSGAVVTAFVAPDGHGLTTGLATGVGATGIRIPAGGGFDRWQALRFDLTALADAGVGGADGDPDEDGMGNFLEYVLGGDPLTADREVLPQFAVMGGDAVFSYTRDAESATDTLQLIQYGAGLDGWVDLGMEAPEVTVGPVISGKQTVTAVLTMAALVEGRVFMRLNVSAVPE